MMHAIHSGQESVLTGHRFFLLFVFLLATLILYPYAESSHFGYYAFRAIGSFAILISVYAAKIHRSLLILAIALAIPALFQRVMLPKADASALSTLNLVLSFVFDVVSGYFPPRVCRRAAQFGNHLRSSVHLPAGGIQFCQRLRNVGRLSAKRILSRSAH